MLQFCSLSFDGSFFEFLMPLTSGGSLHLARHESLIPGLDLLDLLRSREISIALFPPSALETLPYGDLPALQTILVAGESVRPSS